MKSRAKQQGLAVIVFLALLTTAAAGMAVKVLSNGNTQIQRDKITAAALAQAKEALIGFAITYAETHTGEVLGYLPCPDTSGTADFGGEGASTGNCGAQNISVIGRLPWKTLKLPPLRGGDNECLWYAVSGTYKNNIKTGLMNWDTNGLLQVKAYDGTMLTPAEDQAVAVIFAPGSVTTGQNRAGTTAPICGGNYTASNYLDTVGTTNNATVSATANANSTYRLGDPASPSADRIAFITKQDIWNAMKQRKADLLVKLDVMTNEAAKCLANFGKFNKISGVLNPANKSLPWPAQLSLSDYTDNVRYNDNNNGDLVGRVPYRVNTSQSDAHNSILSPYYLLQANGSNCPTPTEWAASYPWWENWKDHLFYAISARYKPAYATTSSCTNGQCLSVNSSGLYAAVVIFAGDKLTGQIRTDKSIVSTYLEGRNATNINGFHNGHADYQSETATIPASSTFNDIVYCIKEDLSVVPGSATGCP